MVSSAPIDWDTLDRWRARAFILAGGLFLASPVAKGLALVTAGSPAEWVVALLAFSGLVASLVGLLGFYPELSEHVPRHALAGAGATGLALFATAGVGAWLLGTRLLSATAFVATPVSLPGVVFVSLVAALATAFAVVGTATLRAPAPRRTIGCLLVALAVPWVTVLAAGAVYAAGVPVWLSLASYGAIPLGLVGTGYSIRNSAHPVRGEAVAGDVPTS